MMKRSISLETDNNLSDIKQFALQHIIENFPKKKEAKILINDYFLIKAGIKIEYKKESGIKSIIINFLCFCKKNLKENKSFHNYSSRLHDSGETPLKMSFGTTLKEEELIDKIFEEKEFSYEIPSPRSEKYFC